MEPDWHPLKAAFDNTLLLPALNTYAANCDLLPIRSCVSYNWMSREIQFRKTLQSLLAHALVSYFCIATYTKG